MEGVDVGSVYTTVGQVLGTPAALCLFWVISKIKELQTKVKILEEENASFKECLTNIRVDVSWMRGNMEGRKETKDG
jgi:hypothetical protein